MMKFMAKFLIITGLLLVLSGILLLLFSRGLNIGRLPGDIYIKKGNFVFYFPVTTSILLSILLSLIIYFLFRKC